MKETYLYTYSLLDYQKTIVLTRTTFFGSSKHAAFEASKEQEHIPYCFGFKIHKQPFTAHQLAKMLNQGVNTP